jgi:hypothetical protein
MRISLNYREIEEKPMTKTKKSFVCPIERSGALQGAQTFGLFFPQAQLEAEGGRLRGPTGPWGTHSALGGPPVQRVSTSKTQPNSFSYDGKINRLFAALSEVPRRCSATIDYTAKQPCQDGCRGVPTEMPFPRAFGPF